MRFLLDGEILYIQQLSHPPSFTERSMMLLLGTLEILLKLSFYVFYHGVFLLASQSSLNNAPPALIPQDAVCFTVVLWPLPHTVSHHPRQKQQPVTTSQGETKPQQLRLRHRPVLGPCTTRAAQRLLLPHASGKITLNSTAQLTHIFILVMFRPILYFQLPLFLSLYYDFIWAYVF